MTVTQLHPDELSVLCPVCGAGPQEPCTLTDADHMTRKYHLRRVDKLWRRRRR